MDRGKWEKMLNCFQASARGYLVRKEVRRARDDFQDIVKEIDGGLTYLHWKEAVIPIPHFTDSFLHHQDGLFLRPSSSASKPSRSGLDVCVSPQSPSEKGDHHALLQKTEAERDDSQTKLPSTLTQDCLPSCSVTRDVEGRKESPAVDKDGMMECTGDSTTLWSSLELDMNCGHSHKGAQQYRLTQDVPRTTEALRLHRNTLTMELLWLQQAIDSRKKYLSLKNRLSVS